MTAKQQELAKQEAVLKAQDKAVTERERWAYSLRMRSSLHPAYEPVFLWDAVLRGASCRAGAAGGGLQPHPTN